VTSTGKAAINDCAQHALWTERATRSPMQEAQERLAQPGIISFSLGLPGTDLFPTGEFAKACGAVLEANPQALQYGPPSHELKSHIVSLMRARGVSCHERQVFLTNGAQQGLHLIISLLLDRGRQIIAENISYPGFHQIVGFYEPEVLPVSTDPKTGMDVDKVEWYLAKGMRPAFVYAIPDGHNPFGVSMSVEKRSRLLALAEYYRFVIVEDDPYGSLFYSDPPANPMRALCGHRVYYVGSFSKILAPSLRIGWLVVPDHLVPYLSIIKEACDIHVASFSQHLVAHLLNSGFLTRHVEGLRSEYRRRRNTMLAALSRQFPSDAEWESPDCGIYIWLRLPKHINATRLLDLAASQHAVAFMPGSVFCIHSEPSAASSLRLNFSYPSMARIDEGMLRLGAAVSSAEKRSTRGRAMSRGSTI
jgi:2-aminoadipate transaminase